MSLMKQTNIDFLSSTVKFGDTWVHWDSNPGKQACV